MCCLSGAAGAVSSKEERVVKQLLMIGQLRGTDSTGIISLSRSSNSACLAKEMGPPDILMDSKRFEKVFYGTNKIYLGHNRSRTIGATKRSNAHPFLFDHIFGAHNGTVHDGLRDLPEQFDTDSETILSSINSIGVEKTIPLIRGAWALTWYDNRDDTLNFIRNKERPLYFSFSKDKKAIFWASMVEMLALTLNHNDIERDTPKSVLLPEDRWYKFAIPKFSSDSFKDPVIMTLEGKKQANFRVSGTTTGVEDEDDNPFGAWGQYDTSGIAGYLPIRGSKEARVNAIVKEGTAGVTTVSSPQVGVRKITESSADNNVVDLKGNLMTPERARAFAEAAEKVVAKKRNVKEEWPLVFLGPTLRIHFHPATYKFAEYRHFGDARGWIRNETVKTPEELQNVNLSKLVLEGKRIDGYKYNYHKGISPDMEPVIPESQRMVWRGNNIIIAKKKDADAKFEWVKYLWHTAEKKWTKVEETFAPLELPFTLIDVRASHCFHHRGKSKKNKEILYKGYLGSFLDRSEFNSIMENGCFGCGRNPEWLPGDWGGVKVKFIAKDSFLCEHCLHMESSSTKLIKEAENRQTERMAQGKLLN